MNECRHVASGAGHSRIIIGRGLIQVSTLTELLHCRWDCVKDDMESLGLSRKDARFGNGQAELISANTGSPGKLPFKRSVCV